MMNADARAHDLSYRTKEDAILDGVPANLVIHTADEFFCSEDDAIQCNGCDAQYFDRHELDDDFLCPDCAQNARDGEENERQMHAEWSATRGCDMGGSGW